MGWTANDISKTTSTRILYFRDYLRCAEKARYDKECLTRETKGECRYCYYVLRAIAGQAFTEYECAHCGERRDHHNTAVPKICITCAHELRLCRRCGGAINWTEEP